MGESPSFTHHVDEYRSRVLKSPHRMFFYNTADIVTIIFVATKTSHSQHQNRVHHESVIPIIDPCGGAKININKSIQTNKHHHLHEYFDSILSRSSLSLTLMEAIYESVIPIIDPYGGEKLTSGTRRNLVLSCPE